MTNYSRGANYERKVKKDLQDEGWPLVVRAAGSHGPVDLVAVGAFEVLLIQCKLQKPTAAERRGAKEAAAHIGRDIELRWPGGSELATGTISRRETTVEGEAQHPAD